MKSLRERQDSQYIDHDRQSGVTRFKKTRRLSPVSSILCVILAVFFMISTVSVSFQNLPLTAYADDEGDAKEELEDKADDYIVDEEEGDPFWKTLEKMNDDNDPSAKNDFGSVMARLFTTQYMNDTSKGSSQLGLSNGINGSGMNCHVNAPGAGTPMYHNCDVPNIVTELIQDAASFLMQSGPNNSDVQSVTLNWGAFGLPDSLPDDGAPVDPSARGVKYTGLELYGYNMRLTTYVGEWDHIKVMTSARALANFGWMDNIKMSVTSIFEGVGTGLEVASDNFTDGISTGDVFGAIGGFFTGFFEGGAAGGIHSILDTSDLNVFNTYAWYRVGYGGTLYGARELTGAEIAARARTEMLNMITSGRPEDAFIPEDLAAISEGPDYPIDAISKCVLNRGDLSDVEWGKSDIAPGITEEACRLEALSQYEQRQSEIVPDPSATEPTTPTLDDSTYVWTRDGNRAEETLTEWKARHSSLFATASQYGITCTVGDDETLRDRDVASFKACWPEAYVTAVDEALKAAQTDNNIEWVNEKLDSAALREWVAEDPARNFNAPWNRFVCTDDNGYDMRGAGGVLTMLYRPNGTLNPDCSAVRPPIQNGLFGNGYKDGQTQPGIDTRNALASSSFLSTLIPLNSLATGIGNTGLGIATFFTQVSNSVINLTFSPVFETLGLDTVVITLIEQFRDSIFFPLVALMVAVTGVMALWSAGKNKDYRRQFISILLMAGTILSGVFLMFRPEMTLRMVDEVPAMVERAIIGSIFSIGNAPEDKICESSATMPSMPGVGLDGSAIILAPNVSTRTLMCENWRAFAYNPYIFGQWGTDTSNLYANGSGAPSTMMNTNGDLVGDAAVNMGAGHVVRNWGLYQLDVMSSGTASHEDPSNPTAKTDRNFYRIIDMQAGPQNGAGTDDRYWDSWNGSQWGDRVVVGFLSPLVALIGAITVIVYSFSKIQIAFATVAMLMFLPFMFLFGIHPTIGRSKLKGYVGTILGLMLQRVVLVLMMAVMFKVVIGFTTASNNYLFNSIAAVIACVAFLSMRKEILNMVFGTISSKLGAPVGGQFVTDPEQWQKSNIIARPNGLIANKTSLAVKGVQSVAAGSIAGFMTGGVAGASKSARNAFNVERSNLLNIQRRRGYGTLQSVLEATDAGKKAAQTEIWKDESYKEAEKIINSETKAYKQYEADLQEYNEFEGEVVKENNMIYKKNDADEIFDKPIAPKLKRRDKAATTRNIQHFAKIKKTASERVANEAAKYYEDKTAQSEYKERADEFARLKEEEGSTEDFMADVASDNKFRNEKEFKDNKARLEDAEKLKKEKEKKYLDAIVSIEDHRTIKEIMRENISKMVSKTDQASKNRRPIRSEEVDNDNEESGNNNENGS